ncbi:MAG: hypothetical protein HQM03_03405 [Magnetococcales bacterium]|nr:hypothetical protein [Magnetococcales bacterium]
MENFWPALKGDTEFSPVSVLREQARYLAERTEWSVIAEVVASQLPEVIDASYFKYSFNLFAPSINYRYNLFSIYYDLNYFPLVVRLDEIYKNDFPERRWISSVGCDGVVAHNKEQYLDLIRKILRSSVTINILSIIMSHIEEEVQVSE